MFLLEVGLLFFEVSSGLGVVMFIVVWLVKRKGKVDFIVEWCMVMILVWV